MGVLLRAGQGPRVGLRSWLAAALVMVVLLVLARNHRPPDVAEVAAACDSMAGAACASAPPARSSSTGPVSASVLRADEVCSGVGYLCADLSRTDRIRIQRWTTSTGPLVVHVPLPEDEEASYARQLRNAAATGIRAWDGHPFPIAIDERGRRDAAFSVDWRRTLGGSRLGVARTQWRAGDGRRVLALELATRDPFDPRRPLDPAQVRLTAAHEMGHALGLPHSDEPRDVMYPTNRAMSLSAQDYRTMEALYELPDGTEIVR